ncbi:SMAD/FHA domain-containing protein [Punctularia strigosozonata HHB-11173 SS5]|uniref:SMAD/FHA domain-containing protein n=1 Tax=Punctularia strigosozonata (strain HHB-11173) TaxID=741275 RepID=UPI0004417CB7|nr:SMAD/FHA domain-containing protein [Punctularia strigosozonata HHB-11173 SS5]EIN05625.1 SMAD/FHA domain-containing protein [Punctularia strigosozonata HHB-11173 SS5]
MMDPYGAPAGAGGTDSPPLRQPTSTGGILGSFLGRSRRHSNSHLNPPLSPTADSPLANGLPRPPSPNANGSGHRRRGAASPSAVQASQSQGIGLATPIGQTPSMGGALSGMLALRRRRSAGALAAQQQAQQAQQAQQQQQMPAPAAHTSTSRSPRRPSPNPNPNAPVHRIRLVPHLDSRRSLRFDAIARDVREGDPPLRIGRFTDRSGMGLAAANALSSNKLAFKSKVVSRAHAEIWCESPGKFYIKDTKSSSGTFLNHVRLSAAGAESQRYELRDGDILQLGVDYQGGAEDIYKCVKIRVEVGREWQAAANAFNTNALEQLKSLSVDPAKAAASGVPSKKTAKMGMPDCCICLFSVTIQQSLFIAPCSHAFHYKCIRPLLDAHYPSFSCPLCRTYADLEADVEVDNDEDEDELDADGGELAAATGALSRIGTRDREDNAYPETDIEPDTGATRLAIRRRGEPAPQAIPSQATASGDAGADLQDLEMVDGERGASPLGVLSEDDEPLPSNGSGSASGSGIGGLDEYAHLYAGGRGGEADEGIEAHLMAIEGEGRRSASPPSGSGSAGAGVAGEDGVDADGTVGAKRKR